MFLKSIELRGFKSFAYKTELLFKTGVTSIVGPNGSGKSNISDAVKWVLGEQSVKSLRGGKMEDVIFAGTQFRKPVGLAQVSMLLDNSDRKLPIDYSDVTITRRLFRSGESEYYINNTQCRLKDIQELFMDTGIGKEGYSIIGQGKIEAVLSGKPEERRNLIEEAAGIVKYKYRKEEAEKKLSNTDQNLIRINDILGTYDERYEPLKIESEKAKEFVKLSQELKKKEVNYIIFSIDKIKEKTDKINKQVFEINDKIALLVSSRNDNKASLDKLNCEIEELDLKNSTDKQKLFDFKTNYNNINSENDLLNEKIENTRSNIEKAQAEYSILDKKIIELNEQKNQNINELDKSKTQQKQLEEKINILNLKLNSINVLTENELNLVRGLKDEQIDFLSEISSCKNEIIVVENEIRNLNSKLEYIKTSFDAYLETLKLNQDKLTNFKQKNLEIKSQIVKFSDLIENKKQCITEINLNLVRLDQKNRDLNMITSKMEAEHNMLENLERHYEGYNRTVKTLMQHIKSGEIKVSDKNCMLLGDIITVKKEFETAMEISLGSSISGIITSDENIAKSLISYLKEKKLGRATFLPLTTITPKYISNVKSFEKIDGYLGIAAELIEYNPVYKNAVEYVLGRTIISRDMDSALTIAKVANFSIKIVTLSGDVVNAGGSLTGGSATFKGANVIGRKREIIELAQKIMNAKNELEDLNFNICGNKEKTKLLEQDCINLKDSIYAFNVDLAKISVENKAIEDENKRILENKIISNNEKENINALLKASKQRILDYNLKINALSIKVKENSALITEKENNLKSGSMNVNKFSEQLTQVKINKARLDEIVLNYSRQHSRIIAEIKEQEVKLIKIKSENTELAMTIVNHGRLMDDNREKLKILKENIDLVELVINKYSSHRTNLREQIITKSAQLENESIILEREDGVLNRYNINLAKYETENETLYKKLNEELELTYAEALIFKTEILNIENCKSDIITLKNKINELGIVNVSSIKDFEELKEKLIFMKTQKIDLISSRDELSSVIEEMTKKMKIVFSENFEILKENFDEIFKELFKGGRADLILSEADMLNGNIEINVEPPGKKLQNINLLSGGEKVLSAIALLFAILKMKPSPFCILDEIEAALDDANVIRYADFLRKFSKHVQFIIITHRKGTMEASDILYGITMEEKGISKVVSVDLKEGVVN